MLIRRTFIAFCSVLLLAVPCLASQPPAGAQGGQVEGFVPVNELPAADQLPAAPLLITAYVFVWLAAMVYLWSIRRRLSSVEREMRLLEERRSKQAHTP